MRNIIQFIIDQQHETIDTYPTLVLPIAEEFNIGVSCAQSIIDTVIEWETDPHTIDSLEVLLTKRFPDIVTN